MACVHARAAVDDRAVLAVDAQLLEPSTQLLRGLESSVGVEVVYPGGADGAWDVSLFRIDRLLLAAIPLSDASVDNDAAGVGRAAPPEPGCDRR